MHGNSGHSTRRQPGRMAVHTSCFQCKGSVRGTNSAVLQHLVEGGDQVGTIRTFKTVLATTRINTKGLHKRFLTSAKSIALRPLKQRKIVPTFFLLWLGNCARYISSLYQTISRLILFSHMYLDSFVHKFLHTQLLTAIPRTVKL